MRSIIFEPKPLAAVTRLSYYPWLVVAATCIGAFIGQVDASIVQLALPALEHDFHAGLSAVSWVAIAYPLTYAATLPIFARLSEMFGRKFFYLAGYSLFTLASALCGMASSLEVLIFLRVIQGISGGLLGANSLTILVKSAGPNRRGRAMGMFASAQAIGVSCGPVVGGLLLSAYGWRSLFFVTVPFALSGVIMGWLLVPQTGETPDKRFDAWGAVLLTPALTAMILVLSEVQAWGLQSPALWTAVGAAVVLLPVFLWRERKAIAPLVDLRLFRSPAFSGGIVAVCLSYALLYSLFLLMSFAFVRGLHATPISAGLHLAVVPVALGLMAPVSGSLYERGAGRAVTTIGMALCAISALILKFALAGSSQGGGEFFLMTGLALFGVGLGLFIAPNNSATIASAPDNRTGEAGGLVNLIRTTGTAIGVAAASTAMAWRLKALTGIHQRTEGAPAQHVLTAVCDVLWMLVAFAILAGGAALLRGDPAARPQAAAKETPPASSVSAPAT
jgi:EmrB/QacA subfamily drug resistance transporter